MFSGTGPSKLHYVSPVYAVAFTLFTITGIIKLGEYQDEIAVYGVLAVILWVLTFSKRSRRTQLVQVITLLVSGLAITGLITPAMLGGDITCMVAVILAYKYGLVRNRPIAITSMMLLPLVVVRVLLYHFGVMGIDLPQLVNQLAIDAMAAPLLFVLFEDELIRMRRHRRELQRLHAENAPFVQFGRNTSGIVHDFKNDLSLFSTFGQLLEIGRDAPLDEGLLERYTAYVDRFRHRIERILFVSRAAHSDDSSPWNVGQAIEASVYVYESNLAFKKLVQFETDLPTDPVYLSGPVFAFLSILENLIRNSCEAISGTGRAGTVSIAAAASEHDVTVTVADTGPGIEFCEMCGRPNCLDCEKLKHIKTTKVDGTGLGLENVRNAALQLEAEIEIKSTHGAGVRSTVCIPFRRD